MTTSEPTTIDAEAKQRVRETLLARAKAAADDLARKVAEEHAASERTGSGATTIDDLSQSDEAGDLGGLVEESSAHAEDVVAQIEGLDFSPTDVVRSGALVGFAGGRYVVGVVSEEFECDGATYEGIAADAPILAALEGLRVGDGFSFAGRTHTVGFVA
ncbi:MAG: hypothetical protein QM572_03960 [Nocardioides sp.]|uniref:hypothetical protein n=1 Tax=Nocardioides sp. TaxID=35761 RepID=UPI0039E4F81F